jgi:polynucleotide 5'-kinase involved in rRNA processing
MLFVDLDPGQPSLTPSGMISIHNIDDTLRAEGNEFRDPLR